MDLVTFGKAISNSLRLQILSSLSQSEGLSLDQCFEKIKEDHKEIHRETVYRALEQLTNTELVCKEYAPVKKRILYFLSGRFIRIDVVTGEVFFIKE